MKKLAAIRSTPSVYGSSALEPALARPSARKAVIIDFPLAGNRPTEAERDSIAQAGISSLVQGLGETGAHVRKRLFNILAASEMYCSLRFEDARGVFYNKLSQAHVRALVSSGVAVAALSIAIGA